MLLAVKVRLLLYSKRTGTREPSTRNMKEHNAIKVLSLVVLTLQNAVLALSMRYSRTRAGALFISSTAVVMAEVVKLVSSILLVYFYEAHSVTHLTKMVYNTVAKQPYDTMKVCIPAVAYLLQNNLLYISASHLDAATNQITYQLKILTTALFAVCLLRRRLAVTQWLALVLLILGVLLVQFSDAKDKSPAAANGVQQNRWVGMAAALAACFLSGFAGVFFEKILKSSDISVWMRNIQMSILTIPAGLVHCMIKDGSEILSNGFFYGYDGFVVYLVFLQAIGGLLVAVVVKYADNILKGFATSLAIVLSCLFSIYLFSFVINYKFILGALLVIISVFLYSKPVKQEKPKPYHDVERV